MTDTPSEPLPPSPAAPVAAPPDGLADLRARLYDAALGELPPEDLAALQTELSAHPERAALQAELDRAGALLQHTADNPALAPLQPRESWRVQTLHKAKVEAARLRKNRISKSMPVARPPATHRQLAGLTPQSISAHPELVPLSDPPADAAGWLGPGASFAPADAAHPPAVRRLFWAVLAVGTGGILVILFVAVRLMQRWQPLPAATQTSLPPHAPTPPGTALATPARPIAPRELLEWKIRYPAMAQVLNAGEHTVQLELGGVLTNQTWPRAADAAGGAGAAGTDCYLGPAVARDTANSATAATGWNRIDMEGDLSRLTWVYRPDPASGLTIILRPKAVSIGGGWELELRKNITQLAIHDIPAPPGSTAGGIRRVRALAIERLAVGVDQEQLRFKAVTESTAIAPADGREAAPLVDSEWVVLSERLLPVRSGPGRWTLELPRGEPLPALNYILHLTVERAPLK